MFKGKSYRIFYLITLVMLVNLTFSCVTTNNISTGDTVKESDKDNSSISQEIENKSDNVENTNKEIKQDECGTIHNDIENEEFTRSTQGVDISIEEFLQDKKDVSTIIHALSSIMAGQDYNEWLKYVDNTSIEYWSNKKNLNSATKKLPDKKIRLNSLNDYFRYVFIPARKGHKVDEIRYISKDKVKVVQVEDDKESNKRTDIVYYNFIKVSGVWKVRLPILRK